MRFRTLMAAVTPAAAASALAVLPAGGAVSTAIVTSARPAVGHVTPAVSNPLAYRYAGYAATPNVTFSCQRPGSALNCYQPAELARAYDIPTSKYDGSGESIAIVDAFGGPTIADDLNAFDTVFGYPAAKLNIIYPDGQPKFDPANRDELSWSGEIALDVESAHAVAPAATINLVISKSDNDADILSAEQYVVKNDLGSVLSQSYGEAESCEVKSIRNATHALYAQAADKGISVFASSGDDGAAQPTCDGSSTLKSSSLPASDPNVTSVGATSLTATQPTGAYVSETAWNDAYGSSGGGFSQLYNRPGYQASIKTPQGARGVPDVSYSGDVNNGLLIAWSQGDPTQVGDFFLFGGTSAGSPQWAAITALADQAAGHRLGFLNPALYAIAASPSQYGSIFHDVTSGNNTVDFGVPITGYPATTGWDAVTGLGTPDVAHLIQALAG